MISWPPYPPASRSVSDHSRRSKMNPADRRVFLYVQLVNHANPASLFVTIQQQFFTSICVRCTRGGFVHFPPQTGRSAIGGRANGRRWVRVNSIMDRFLSNEARAGGRSGADDAGAAGVVVLLGDFAVELRSDVILPSVSGSSFLSRLQPSRICSGNDDTGLVTIGDYLYLEAEARIAAPPEQGRLHCIWAAQKTVRICAMPFELGLSTEGLGLDATRAKGPSSPPRDRSPGGIRPSAARPGRVEAKEAA